MICYFYLLLIHHVHFISLNHELIQSNNVGIFFYLQLIENTTIANKRCFYCDPLERIKFEYFLTSSQYSHLHPHRHNSRPLFCSALITHKMHRYQAHSMRFAVQCGAKWHAATRSVMVWQRTCTALNNELEGYRKFSYLS